MIGKELKHIKKSHGGYLNHWVGCLIQITVPTWYDIQYITRYLSSHMNATTSSAFLALIYGMEYLMHHHHQPMIYSRNNISKVIESPH